VHGQSLTVALWRRRWTALLLLVLTLAATALWLGLAPRRYTAVATVTAAPQPGAAQSAGGASDLVDTVAGLANSGPVLQDVLASTGAKRSVTVLQREVRGQRITATVLIRIRVTDGNPAVARRIANAVADTLPLHDPTSGRVVFTDAGRAATPHSPSSPQVTPAVLLGVGAGIVLAVLGALAHAGMSRRVERPEQVAELADAQVLGVVARPADVSAVQVARPGPATDDFRRVRVALEFAGSVAPTRTIVVSSVDRDPAAGWLAVNLAASLAEVQHRVLLIDADFSDRPRHPVLAGKGDGLVDLLAGRADPADVIASSDVPGVSVLSVGDLEATAPASLVELHFHALLAELGEDDFDIVLVHAAPLAESDDARVMAAGNSLLITVPLRRVRAAELRRAVSDVHRMRLRLLGTVLIGPRRKR
jgi:succinoglycan biosynthesis transport protein ExoP